MNITPTTFPEDANDLVVQGGEATGIQPETAPTEFEKTTTFAELGLREA